MRRLLYLLLALCLPLPLAADMDTQETDDGRLQWDVRHVDNNKIAVRVRFEAKKDVKLKIVGEDIDDGTRHQRKTYEFDVKQGNQLETVLWFPVRNKYRRWHGIHYGSLALHITADGRDVLKRRARSMSTLENQPIQVALIGDRNSTAMSLTGSTHKTLSQRDNRIDVSHYRPSEAPTNRFGWTGVDIILIDNLPDNALDPQQITAIEDYVLAGGGLVWLRGSRSNATQLEKMWTVGVTNDKLTNRGHGKILVSESEPFSKMAEDSKRGTVVRPFLDSYAYIRPGGQEGSNREINRFNAVFNIVTDHLFSPPNWLASLLIICGTILSLVFARFWSQRGNRRVFFPVVISVISGTWLLVIYIYGTIHHGLGTTSRSLVVLNPLNDRKVMCQESWGVMTSFATNRTYSVQSNTEILMLDDTRGVEYEGGEPSVLRGAPLRIWKPTAFVAESIRPLEGRLVINSQALNNDTRWDFDGALIWTGQFFICDGVKKGELTRVTPFLDKKGNQVRQYHSALMLELQKQFNIEDETLLRRALDRTLRSLNYKADRSFVVAWGRKGLTLLDDTENHDETLMIWHDEF